MHHPGVPAKWRRQCPYSGELDPCKRDEPAAHEVAWAGGDAGVRDHDFHLAGASSAESASAKGVPSPHELRMAERSQGGREAERKRSGRFHGLMRSLDEGRPEIPDPPSLPS